VYFELDQLHPILTVTIHHYVISDIIDSEWTYSTQLIYVSCSSDQ